ncbi:MAG: DUF4405 domain-containing protein [Lachnospiraceae bacterium]|nr:DUF4405 domain-containing protein [Lachnospiraceae bacterium]
MGIKQKVRICVDFAMILLMPGLMAYSLISGKMHERLGMAMFLLFCAHHLLNLGWYRAMIKGHYTAPRIVRTALNMLLLIVMALLAVSSVIMSGYAPWDIKGGMAFARLAHLASSYWGFVLASFHLGIYWNRMLAAKRMQKQIKAPFKYILGLVFLAYAVYGVYAFLKRRFAAYMFLKVQFVFFDYGESAVLFFAEYFAVMCLFAVIGHYVSVCMNRLNRSGKRRTVKRKILERNEK